MHSIRINVTNSFIRLFVSILVPDCNFESHYLPQHCTGVPLFAALARIASHSFAIRNPTSGGDGLTMLPLRTARNWSHTPMDGGTGIGAGGFSPSYCTARVSPQTPVCKIALSQNTRISEAQDGIVSPQPWNVTNPPEARRPIATANVSTGRPL